MSLQPNEQFVDGTSRTPQLRVVPRAISPKTIAAALTAALLPVMTPLSFNPSTGYWIVWSGKLSEIDTITNSGTVSGGTYTITVDGTATAGIAFNANAATIQAALMLLPDIKPGDIVVTGGPLNTTPVVLTFGGNYKNKTVVVTVDPSSLTGGGSAALVQTQAGVTNEGFKGFLWPTPATLSTTQQTLATVMTAGQVHVGALIAPAGEDIAVLKAELRTVARPLDFDIQGLDAFR